MTGSISIRFPDGAREFRYPTKPLEVGDVLYHDGARYRLLSIASDDGGHDFATVELVPDGITDLLQSEEGALHLVAVE